VTDETCHNRILLVDPTLIDPEMQDCNPVSLNRNNRASFYIDAPAELAMRIAPEVAIGGAWVTGILAAAVGPRR